jgi:hypothetical protein
LATWNGPGPAGRDSGPPRWRPRWRLRRPLPGRGRPIRRLRWLGVARIVALAAVPLAVASVILPVSDAGTAQAQASSCGKATGPFTVHGTKILAANGSTFISYGMSVSGLQEGNWAQLIPGDLARIKATALAWCANTVRIQADEDLLLGTDGRQFNSEYLAAIESEVSLAESYRLVVVLNDETNFAPKAAQGHQAGPTRETELFWKDMARIYGHDPQVIFDLYNEPRTSVPSMGDATLWRLWYQGGRFKGVYYPFGMEGLASYVRNTVGARNLFWIEGPRYSLSFQGMIRYHALINVSGVVYAIHHAQGTHDVQGGNAAFGYLVADGIAPVVNGEFTNYEPLPNPNVRQEPGYCWDNAPTAVPLYLDYLARMGIGMSAYQLVYPWLVASNNDLDHPTSMNPKTWSCKPWDEPQPAQSAGALVMAWFKQRNG